jgi:hypothetical protein
MKRMLTCPWCWRALGITRWYPRRFSSNICRRHERTILAQRAAIRAAQQAAQAAREREGVLA